MTVKTLVATNPYLQINNQGQLVNFELNRSQHILGRDPQLADLCVPDNWQLISRTQATLRQDGKNYYIFDGDGTTPSGNRLYLDRALISPQIGCLLTHGMSLNIGLDPASTIRVTYINPRAGSITPIGLAPQAVSLKQKNISLGRDAGCTLQLDAPTISRTHATIDTSSAI
jgi:ABC transport system ATP-binding/permease protein